MQPVVFQTSILLLVVACEHGRAMQDALALANCSAHALRVCFVVSSAYHDPSISLCPPVCQSKPTCACPVLFPSFSIKKTYTRTPTYTPSRMCYSYHYVRPHKLWCANQLMSFDMFVRVVSVVCVYYFYTDRRIAYKSMRQYKTFAHTWTRISLLYMCVCVWCCSSVCVAHQKHRIGSWSRTTLLPPPPTKPTKKTYTHSAHNTRALAGSVWWLSFLLALACRLFNTQSNANHARTPLVHTFTRISRNGAVFLGPVRQEGVSLYVCRTWW